jgi:heme/copper-type cytochrome/quinol oxidase subunit 4
VEDDIEDMRAEERAQQAEATISISMLQLKCSPTLLSPLIIAVVMQLSQQLSGINAVSILGSENIWIQLWGRGGNRKNETWNFCSLYFSPIIVNVAVTESAWILIFHYVKQAALGNAGE